MTASRIEVLEELVQMQEYNVTIKLLANITHVNAARLTIGKPDDPTPPVDSAPYPRADDAVEAAIKWFNNHP